MKIGIFGTGIVGHTPGSALASKDHEVVLGTPMFNFKIAR